MALTSNITINDVTTCIEISQNGNDIVHLDFNRDTFLIDINAQSSFDIDIQEFTTGIQVTDLWFRRIAKIPLVGFVRPFNCEFKRSLASNKIEGFFEFLGSTNTFSHEFDEDTGILSVDLQPNVTVSPAEFSVIFGLFRDTLMVAKFPRS